MGLEVLPKGRPFFRTFADPREIRMAIAFEGDSKIQASIGNYFSLLGIRPTDEDSWRFHFGLEGAGFFMMRSAQGRFPLETADGLIGAYAEWGEKNWVYQLRYTHISAHLADGIQSTPIPYSRETLSARVGWSQEARLYLYGGYSYLANTVPKLNPHSFQVGGAYFLNLGLGSFAPFTGWDFKWRDETQYKWSSSLQLGIALNNPPEAYRSFRFFYAYFRGSDPRGQFYDQLFESHSLGIEMQI